MKFDNWSDMRVDNPPNIPVHRGWSYLYLSKSICNIIDKYYALKFQILVELYSTATDYFSVSPLRVITLLGSGWGRGVDVTCHI